MVNKGHDEGRIDLTAGRHRIEVGERNLGGGSLLKLMWRVPGTQDSQLMPAGALIPDRIEN
jgi:hypothetical protein